MNTDFIGIGTVVVDHQVFLAKYPDWDTKTDIQNDRLQVGGPVPTALVFLARLGKRCGFVGKWGDDHLGRFIEKDLRAEGLNLEHGIRVRGASSGFAQVWIELASGRRTIACSRGSFPPIAPPELGTTPFSQCRFLYLDGWSGPAALVAARKVKKTGGSVFLDAGSPKPGLAELLPLVDAMVCPQRFAQQFFGTADTGQSAARLMQSGVNTVVFTAGRKGATLYGRTESIHQPAFAVETVDTTGAGDVFCGALLCGLAEDKPPKDALAFAAAAAALKCTKPGNRDALPTRTEIGSLLATC